MVRVGMPSTLRLMRRHETLRPINFTISLRNSDQPTANVMSIIGTLAWTSSIIWSMRRRLVLPVTALVLAATGCAGGGGVPASSTTQTQATANAQASVLGPAAKACSVVGVSADGLTLRSGQMSISQAKCLLRELGAGSTDYLDMSSQSGGSTTTPIASVTWRSDGVATVDLSATASARPRPGVTDSPASQAQLTKADVELTVKIMSKECFG